jgi:hypothetical protein
VSVQAPEVYLITVAPTGRYHEPETYMATFRFLLPEQQYHHVRLYSNPGMPSPLMLVTIRGLIDISLAAVFEVLAILLAAWTAVLVARTRRRVRQMRAATDQTIHRTLIMRVLLFGVVLAAVLV